MALKLKGLDISHHNRNMKDPAELNRYDFVIIKATEGTTYKDPTLKYWLNNLDKYMLKGFYHYARPEIKNSAEAEARNFINTIQSFIDGRCILALDVEGDALRIKDLDSWCLRWCKYVYDTTGIKPLIYCSESTTSKLPLCASFGSGLWVAKWGITKPKKIAPWKFFAIWQKTSNHYVSGVRCDLNYFNGTVDQYLKYCQEEVR